MGKSLNEMKLKEQFEKAHTGGLRISPGCGVVGPDGVIDGFSVSLASSPSIVWDGKDFARIVNNLINFEREVNKTIINPESWVIPISYSFFNFVQIAYPFFVVEQGYPKDIKEWKDGKETITNAAADFFLWRHKNGADISAYSSKNGAEIKSIATELGIDFTFAEFIFVERFFLDAWVNGDTSPTIPAAKPSQEITIKQPGAIVVPDSFRAVLTDYQFLNKLLHGDEYEEINGKKTQKRDGEKLKGFKLITHRDGAPLLYRDKLVLFAIKSIADRNKVIDNGVEIPAFTVSDVLMQLQPTKTRGTVYNPDSELYKEVAASIERLRQTEVAIYSEDFAQNRRLEELPEGGVIAKKAPLIIASPAIWKRRKAIVEGYLWTESEPIKMLFADFEARFSVQVAREIIPNNLNKEKLELFAFLLERARANLPTLNNIDIYADGDENKKTLLSELGWLDISLIPRAKDKTERKKDQTQREQIENMLKAFENAVVTISETNKTRRVMRFEVERKLSETRRKLIGFRIKTTYETVKLLKD